MGDIKWSDFEKVDLRAGTIIDVKDFPEARHPAYIVQIDFGEILGVRKSSAQITDLYTKEQLLGKQVVCVVNFPEKQIGPIKSQVLITGFEDENGKVVLTSTERTVKNGTRIS